MRAAGSQRIQVTLAAPGQVTVQVRFGVGAGGALEAGQIGSYGQPQLISERHTTIGGG